jgi:hypothetical protein
VSPVLYARISEVLKRDLEAYASEHGLSQSAAAARIIERGLQALSNDDSKVELEESLAASVNERQRTRMRLREVELQLEAAQEREELTRHAYRGLAERAGQQLASCPRCREPVHGADLLVSGRCSNCQKALTSLLLPAPRARLERDEYLALLGALGVLTGLAIARVEQHN